MIVFGGEDVARGVRRAPADHGRICAHVSSGFPLFHPTWLGRLEWFRQHPYDLRAHRCEDQDLLLRTHAASKFANVTTPLLGYYEDRLIGRTSAPDAVISRSAQRGSSWSKAVQSALWRCSDNMRRKGRSMPWRSQPEARHGCFVTGRVLCALLTWSSGGRSRRPAVSPPYDRCHERAPDAGHAHHRRVERRFAVNGSASG